jgi:multicomponent Na+:H+ antiporter subunit G
MIDFVTGALLFLGALFLVIAAVGLLRMPDLFMRMSTTTKASVLCVGLVLAGGAFFFADLAVTTKVFAVVVFVGLTAPVAAHMIGRAAYQEGVTLWHGTLFDDLRGKYDPETHDPASPEQG